MRILEAHEYLKLIKSSDWTNNDGSLIAFSCLYLEFIKITNNRIFLAFICHFMIETFVEVLSVQSEKFKIIHEWRLQ